MNMKSKESVMELIYAAYDSMGQDAKDITDIVPEMPINWEKAASYRVTRQDNHIARVWSKDIDDDNDQNIKISLELFQPQ